MSKNIKIFCYKDELVLFEKIYEESKKRRNWGNERQKPSKNQENIRNGM